MPGCPGASVANSVVHRDLLVEDQAVGLASPGQWRTGSKRYRKNGAAWIKIPFNKCVDAVPVNIHQLKQQHTSHIKSRWLAIGLTIWASSQ